MSFFYAPAFCFNKDLPQKKLDILELRKNQVRRSLVSIFRE